MFESILKIFMLKYHKKSDQYFQQLFLYCTPFLCFYFKWIFFFNFISFQACFLHANYMKIHFWFGFYFFFLIFLFFFLILNVKLNIYQYINILVYIYIYDFIFKIYIFKFPKLPVFLVCEFQVSFFISVSKLKFSNFFFCVLNEIVFV